MNEEAFIWRMLFTIKPSPFRYLSIMFACSTHLQNMGEFSWQKDERVHGKSGKSIWIYARKKRAASSIERHVRKTA